jgi:hypothetical protein
MALGILPFFFFFLGLVAQLIRLGLVTGHELIVDSRLLPAWCSLDPGATWQKYAKKAAGLGYKVHMVLCRQAVSSQSLTLRLVLSVSLVVTSAACCS